MKSDETLEVGCEVWLENGEKMVFLGYDLNGLCMLQHVTFSDDGCDEYYSNVQLFDERGVFKEEPSCIYNEQIADLKKKKAALQQKIDSLVLERANLEHIRKELNKSYDSLGLSGLVQFLNGETKFVVIEKGYGAFSIKKLTKNDIQNRELKTIHKIKDRKICSSVILGDMLCESSGVVSFFDTIEDAKAFFQDKLNTKSEEIRNGHVNFYMIDSLVKSSVDCGIDIPEDILIIMYNEEKRVANDREKEAANNLLSAKKKNSVSFDEWKKEKLKV